MFKNHEVHVPIEKKNVGGHHNLHKRRFDNDDESSDNKYTKRCKVKAAQERVKYASPVEPQTVGNHSKNFHAKPTPTSTVSSKKNENRFQNDEKKQNSDKKRQESLKKKRQEFNEKKNIIKTGLVNIVSCEKILVVLFITCILFFILHFL